MNKLLLSFILFFTIVIYGQEKFFSEGKNTCSHLHSKLNFKNIQVAGNEYDLYYANIFWELYPDMQYIKGNVYYEFTLKYTTDSISINLSSALLVDSVVSDGNLLVFNHENNILKITLTNTVNQGNVDSLSIYYQGSPNASIPEHPVFATDTYEYNGDLIPVLWTLSEPYGASEWWPCKNGLTDKIDSIDIFIKTDSIYKCGTAGMLISEDITQGKKIIHWKHKYPITPYLIGIVLTKFEEASKYIKFWSGDSLLMITYSFLNDNNDEIYPSGNRLDSIFNIYTKLFIPYPFINEKYGHMVWPVKGGMEHQTMSSMESTTSGGLVNHELAHQWFGDYITCKSWRDIWLNEGFATWLTSIAYEKMWGGYWHRRDDSLILDDVLREPDGSVYVSDTTEVSRIFSGRLSYSKGRMLLHMLRWELGDSLMFKGIRAYLNDETLKYGFATTNDLVSHLEQEADTSLTEFFNDWFYGEGYPNYIISYESDGNNVDLNIAQDPSHPSVSFFEMHVPIQFWHNGNDTTIIFYNTYNNQEFYLSLPNKVDSIVFDPDFHLVAKSSVIQGINILNNPNITILPNPCKDYLEIKITELPIVINKIRLTDMLGKTTIIEGNSSSYQRVDMHKLAKGTYILSIETNSFNIYKKIIKN